MTEPITPDPMWGHPVPHLNDDDIYEIEEGDEEDDE